MAEITAQGRITIDAIRRFRSVSKKSLANYLVQVHPDLFLNSDNEPDIEVARQSIRHYTGARGKNSYKTPLVMKIPPTKAIKKTPYILPEGLWLVVSDLHVPLHSQFAIERVLEIAQIEKVNGLFINGDLQDCEALSPFVVIGGRRDFIREVEIAIDFLDFLLEEFKGKQIIWKPGNHEDRLEITYARHAPTLAELPTSNMETILSLEKRGIIYLDRKQKVMAHKLPVFHGHELRGGSANLVNPARWLFLKAKHSAMCGHFHRTSEHQEQDIESKDIITWSTGCLCDLNPDYSPFANNWNWGFALINIEKDGYEVRNHRILKDGQIK